MGSFARRNLWRRSGGFHFDDVLSRSIHHLDCRIWETQDLLRHQIQYRDAHRMLSNKYNKCHNYEAKWYWNFCYTGIIFNFKIKLETNKEIWKWKYKQLTCFFEFQIESCASGIFPNVNNSHKMSIASDWSWLLLVCKGNIFNVFCSIIYLHFIVCTNVEWCKINIDFLSLIHLYHPMADFFTTSNINCTRSTTFITSTTAF